MSVAPESWCCVDCGINTAPGAPTRREIEQAFNGRVLRAEPVRFPITFTEDCEVYSVRNAVWKKAGVEPMGGCLCIGCLEKRIGRRLKPKDFPRDHPFNQLPGTPRLLQRRGDEA
jgi:hypothetical protein